MQKIENSTVPQRAAEIRKSSNFSSATVLQKWSFSLLLFYPQAGVLGFGLNYLIFGVGIALFLVGVFRLKKMPRHFLKYGALFFLLFVLHALLFFLGKSGDVPARPLFVTGFATVGLILIAGILTRAPDGKSWMYRSILVCLLLEIAIVFLQFGHMTYGVGLAPRGEDSSYIGLITGSYGNPNNVAVMIALQVFILHKAGKFENHPFLTWVLLLGGLLAIFLTLSRTCFFLYILFLILYVFEGKGKKSKSSILEGCFKFSVVLILVLAAFSYFQGLINDGNSIVLDRSIARLSDLTGAGGDELISFRQTSHERLMQNLLSLGLGSFSDLNYGIFLESHDPELMKVNPHSFLVEMSFLYGYVGFLLAVSFLALIAYDLMRAGLSYAYAGFFFIVAIFFQMIPSSVLSMPAFFLFFVLLASRESSKEKFA
ncbi:hypothetical protein J2W27_003932 [Variovorax boronicumulans]|uniref:hypothetical protein n=1 Tax=Variovorax boronicumulans TaxID=436515 RepID=UPI00278AFDF3|nr:hypothetical protein [Variovorax boronicumulans]MDP9911808.1 hypothetical protein [Variovorax boronicumulans]